MRYLSRLIGLFVLVLWSGTAGALELVMVEQNGCHYCERWHAEIGPAYDNTQEGRFAPVRMVQLRAIPEDLDLTSRPVLTPTFILVRDGRELSRIEGYPGDNWFWPMLNDMLTRHGGFVTGG
jgi:hypothetical protein